MNYQQRRHLDARIAAAGRVVERRLGKPEYGTYVPEPAELKAARRRYHRLQQAHYQKQKTVGARIQRRVAALTAPAREALLFDDPAIALAAVKKLEAAAAKVKA